MNTLLFRLLRGAIFCTRLRLFLLFYATSTNNRSSSSYALSTAVHLPLSNSLKNGVSPFPFGAAPDMRNPANQPWPTGTNTALPTQERSFLPTFFTLLLLLLLVPSFLFRGLSISTPPRNPFLHGRSEVEVHARRRRRAAAT